MCSELVCLEGHGEHPRATWPMELSKVAFVTRSLNVPSRKDWIRADAPESGPSYAGPEKARLNATVVRFSKYLPQMMQAAGEPILCRKAGSVFIPGISRVARASILLGSSGPTRFPRPGNEPKSSAVRFLLVSRSSAPLTAPR